MEEKYMRKLELLAATAALAVAAPLMAQGPRDYAFVPRGMMPPAGMCRVWIQGVPPGRQPAPTSCAVAARWLPVNGRMVYGPAVYNNDRLYQEQIIRERELQIAREREWQIQRDQQYQIARERELQIQRDREFQIAREREAAAIHAREIEAARIREQAIRQHETRDQNHAWDRHNDDHRNDDHRDFKRGDRR
jgi:hypothetical protein